MGHQHPEIIFAIGKPGLQDTHHLALAGLPIPLGDDMISRTNGAVFFQAAGNE
uniref:Uncharacterized protein n=1 Tax=mine drainage metagenome TaxID=410659 RepID=E6QLS2_9ZZZZ